jgi:hypothetical protein
MHPTQAQQRFQHNRFIHHARNSDSTQFFNLLTEPALFDQLEALLPEHRERLFPPTETLSMFLTQAMSSDSSCQNVVNESATHRLLSSLPLCSTDTGAYCRSRKRLPLSMISSLCRHTGGLICRHSDPAWKWRKRPVRLVDGTTVVMPDTPENQQAYPQLGSQKPGIGFPISRLVGLICLGSGALLDMAMAPMKGKGSDEQTLLRALLGGLNKGDLLLGDAFYATYFLFCSLHNMGVDAVFEQHGSRQLTTDFRRGTHLGTRDHIIEISKPKKRPLWMSSADYDQAPNTLQVRECRVGGKTLVTTLLCSKQTSKNELQELYKERWHIELDFRNIKTTLGMERLSCRTPEMVQKEIWVYLLAYNLIRMLMSKSALLADILPRQISFKHTLQLWIAWRQGSWESDDAMFSGLLILIAQNRVGNRPGRVEPRAIKRRPKPIPLLMQPRAIARASILKNGHPKKMR